jgi:hypothetical protein
LLLPPTAVTALSPQQRAANCWRRYEKPCDATKKKVKLFTIKPLFLHVSMSGAPPMFILFCFNRLAPSSALRCRVTRLQFEVSLCDAEAM